MKKLVLASIITLAASSALMADVNLGTCKGCHGQNFEKHALGKSKVVANLSQEEIATALKGYKAGTFGGPMKSVMKGQVSKYSDAELEAAAKTIKKK